jgi:hypothetical protein
MDRKRLSSSFVRLSASLLVALALFTNTGCNEGSNVADNNQQPRSIAEQAVDNIRNNSHGDYSHLPQFLQDAIEVQEDIESGDLLSITGVIGNGVGVGADGKARILIFTEREDVHGIPSELRGIKTQIEHVGPVVAMGGTPKGFTGLYRNPLPCGVSIGNNDDCAAGTLGCLVRGVADGTPYMLSNHHVLEGSNGGSRINQPGRYDSRNCAITGQVATNYLIAPIAYDGSDNVIDAGIATYTSGVAFTGSMVNNLYTPTSNVTLPVPGLAVKKVGRTSGLTTASIAGINVTLNVSYGVGKTGHFVGQIYIANGRFIQSGDSGSLMVASNNNPVGLCFAGSASACFANPITPVLDYFGVAVAQN